MPLLKAFVAKSFDQKDEQKTRQVEDLLDTLRPLGFQWETAERAEIETVSQKVRQKIDDCDLFVGIFTRRHPIFSGDTVLGSTEPPSRPTEWTGPPWLFQETGYALKAGKKLMLLRESQVEFPALQGDLEYIPYEPNAPMDAFKKVLHVLTQLIAQSTGIQLRTSMSAASPQQSDVDEPVAGIELAAESNKEPSFGKYIDDLIDAQFSRDASGIDKAEEAGLQAIRVAEPGQIDEISWRSLCLASRVKIGDTTALQKLTALSAEHPTHRAPYAELAETARMFGEHEAAGDWYSKAADLKPLNVDDRISAAEEYRSAKLLELAREQLELALPSAFSDDSKAEVLKQLFWVHNDSQDPLAAFCFGEAALRLQPNDFNFRFSLAYAYSDVTGGYSQHDYRDLALFHYRLLVRMGSKVDYADNNLGVAFLNLGAPIHAVEIFGSPRESDAATTLRGLSAVSE